MNLFGDDADHHFVQTCCVIQDVDVARQADALELGLPKGSGASLQRGASSLGRQYQEAYTVVLIKSLCYQEHQDPERHRDVLGRNKPNHHLVAGAPSMRPVMQLSSLTPESAQRRA
uniref:Uncharacterized protein n=1 Tax=Arundo donax TaxID=35708 RepID=A0A0A9CBW4_ARUDO